MFLWFKKKEIVLDCFTGSPIAYELGKPDFAYKFFPEWFIKLPKRMPNIRNPRTGENGTIKLCRAFKRYYTANSIILPSGYFGHIKVNTKEKRTFDWRIQTKDTSQGVSSHHSAQSEGFLTDNYQHIKLSSSWSFKTNKFIEFLWSDPIYNRPNICDYTIMPGVIDFKYQHDAFINLVLEYKNDPYELEFKPGQPLVMLTPLSQDYNITIKHHLIDKSKEEPLGEVSTYDSERRYPENKKIIQAADKRDEMKKCPFHLR